MTRSFPKTCSFMVICALLSGTAAHAHDETIGADSNRTGKPSKHYRSRTSYSNSFDPWRLLDLAIPPANAAIEQVSISVFNGYRTVKSNGIPDHATGQFPNRGNPNSISEQQYEFKMPVDPKENQQVVPLRNHLLFGVALNGVPFDPGTAEFWNRDPSSGWQYEAMVLGSRLGLDQNNAHVQPNGAYHYHGPPVGLLEKLAAYERPVLIGYAADGFPVYGPFGFKKADDLKSLVTKVRSSYRVKKGTRESGPGGTYDGSFVQDYEYVEGLGDLDLCNGRHGVTPEYPKGTYYYVVTDGFPFVSRFFRGIPDKSFEKSHAPGFGPGRGFGPPPGFRHGPPFNSGNHSGHGPGEGPPHRPPPREFDRRGSGSGPDASIIESDR